MKLYKITVTTIKLLIAIAEYEVGPDQAPEFYKKNLSFTRKELLYCSERETFEKASPPTED